LVGFRGIVEFDTSRPMERRGKCWTSRGTRRASHRLARAVLHERPLPAYWLGLALIVAGVIVVAR
jgi:hypothetical protein